MNTTSQAAHFVGMPEMKRLYTVKLAAAACSVHIDTIYNAIQRGELRAHKRGARYFIEPEDLECWRMGEVYDPFNTKRR